MFSGGSVQRSKVDMSLMNTIFSLFLLKHLYLPPTTTPAQGITAAPTTPTSGKV